MTQSTPLKDMRPADILMGYVLLDGHIEVPADRLDAVRAGLVDHIALTRQEPGCLHFVVAENADVPGRFDVSETFIDQAAFDAHQERTDQSAWAKISDGIPRFFDIRVIN